MHNSDGFSLNKYSRLLVIKAPNPPYHAIYITLQPNLNTSNLPTPLPLTLPSILANRPLRQHISRMLHHQHLILALPCPSLLRHRIIINSILIERIRPAWQLRRELPDRIVRDDDTAVVDEGRLPGKQHGAAIAAGAGERGWGAVFFEHDGFGPRGEGGGGVLLDPGGAPGGVVAGWRLAGVD